MNNKQTQQRNDISPINIDFESILLFGFIRQCVQINNQTIVPDDIITLCRKYYGNVDCVPNSVKIYGEGTTWSVSPYYSEKGYFLVNVRRIQAKLKNYHPKLFCIYNIYIEEYWKDCAFNIIRRLFTLSNPRFSARTDEKFIYDTTAKNYGEIYIDFGHHTLSVEYNNNTYQIKLPKCGTMCSCYSYRNDPKQSEKNLKRQICHQIADGIITEYNQVWEIKDKYRGDMITPIDPSTENGLKCLWFNGKGHVLLSIDEYETDIIESTKQMSIKEQELKESDELNEAIKLSLQGTNNINTAINVVMDKGYSMEQAKQSNVSRNINSEND